MRLFLTIIFIMTASVSFSAEHGYAPVNGLKIYYELHGPESASQPPLVLLHGGGDTIDTSFGTLLPLLARDRRVIAFEQQGYGRTADIDRPFSFTQSADDTAGLLSNLNISKADFLGFSNGGTIALQIAIRHPSRVGKLIVASAFFDRTGAGPAFWEFMKTVTLETMPSELKEAYLKVAPNPDHLGRMHQKAAERMRNFSDIPRDQLRAIKSPVLVVSGDKDIVRPEHSVELFRILPNGQLAILPEADHGEVMLQTHWWPETLRKFLNN